jgi:hypothetical protein
LEKIMPFSRSTAALAVILAGSGMAAAQDRSACSGIYCPQTKAADYAAEFAPYVAAGKSWEDVKGQNVLVMKYYHPDGTIAATKTWSQSSYMQPVATLPGRIAFAGQGTPTIALYGLSPCTKKGSFNFKGEKFTCQTLWQDRLSDNLYGTQAVICRAYADQIDKPVQQATCIRENEGFGGKSLKGGVVIDDALVGLGVAIIDRDATGKLLRPDLAKVETQGTAIFKSVTN